MRWINTPVKVVVWIIGVIASVIAIYVFETAYPKVEPLSGGIGTPFVFAISDPSYLCLYDVKPVCADVNLPGISDLYIITPSVSRICPWEQPRTFSCRIAGPPAVAGSTVTLKLHYSLHPIPLISFIKWPTDWSLSCQLGETGTWICGKPM
jgi:hypothetical protein